MFCSVGLAQDLVITNARIITGTGETIDRGSVVIEDGRISAVFEGDTSNSDERIDVGGMTVMPGMIDAHWHIVLPTQARDDDAVDRFINSELAAILAETLQMGITSLFGNADFFPEVIELRERINLDRYRAPSVLSVGRGFTAPNDHPARVCGGNPYCMDKLAFQLTTPEQARAAVEEMAQANVDGIKVTYDRRIVPEVRIASEVVEAIVEAASARQMKVYAHTTRTDFMIEALNAGIRNFAHTPYEGPIDDSAAQQIKELGPTVVSTISGNAIAADRGDEGRDVWFRQHLENIELISDLGITLAFGTDYAARLSEPYQVRFWAEINALSRILSNEQIIAMLTRNAAIHIGHGDALGTIEAGKMADLLIVDGDPLQSLSDLANVVLVVQRGRVVVDNR